MLAWLTRILLALRSLIEARASREAEILILRQQLLVLNRKSSARFRLRNIDRLKLVWLSRLFPSLLDAIIIVKPETVLRWHRRAFRAYWRWKSWQRDGRPRIDGEFRALIRWMSKENPTWGAPRIHGELLMLGIDVSESTVGRYMIKTGRPRSQGWRTFLRNHSAATASIDLFVVRTISFKLLYGLVILRHARRRLVRIAVTSNPNSGVDRRASDRGLSLARGAVSPDPRSRWRIRHGLHPAHSRDGHPRSPGRSAFTLAKRVRRASHRFDSPRMS
jgi:hypothetical protein